MKTNDLVYVSSNLRLLAHNAEGNADPFITIDSDDDEEEDAAIAQQDKDSDQAIGGDYDFDSTMAP